MTTKRVKRLSSTDITPSGFYRLAGGAAIPVRLEQGQTPVEGGNVIPVYVINDTTVARKIAGGEPISISDFGQYAYENEHSSRVAIPVWVVNPDALITGPTYVLFDNYLTARAAGAVDGTAAEPTGGNRIVTDEESGVTISGGRLVYAGQSTAVWGEQAVYYPTVVREAGRLMMFKARFGLTNQSLFGFDVNASGIVTENAFSVVASSVSAYAAGSASDVVFSPLDSGTDNIFTIMLRASGAFYCVDRRIVFITTAGTNSPLYPALATLAQSATTDYIKIPTTLFLPTPIASDGFSKADDAILLDSGSNGYHVVGSGVALVGDRIRYSKVNGFSPSALFTAGSGILDDEEFNHEKCSVALQFSHRGIIGTNTLFRMDKTSGGHYISIHMNQFGNAQIFINTSSFFSVSGIPDLSTISTNAWHGVALTLNADEGATGTLRLHYDGAAVGSATGIKNTSNTASWGTSVGIGFGDSGSFIGDIRHVVMTLNGVVMTQAQANALSDSSTTITTSLLDGYFGAGNYAWYKMDDLLKTDGLGHAETSGVGAGGGNVSLTGAALGSNVIRCVSAVSTAANILGTNGNMDGTYDDESGGGGGTVNVPPGWNAYQVETDGTDTIDKDTSAKQSGTASCKISVSAADEGIVYPATGLTAGKWYEFRAAFDRVSGTYQMTWTNLVLGERSRSSTSATWVTHAGRFMLSTTSTDLRVTSSGGAANFNIDNAYFGEADVSTFLTGVNAGTSDIYASVDVTTGGKEGCGIFAMCDSLTAPTEMVYVLIDSVANNASLMQMVAGVTTIQATTAITYSAGGKLTLVTNDTTGEVRAYYGTVLIGSFTRNAALTGNTNVGIFAVAHESSFDNFVVYDALVDGLATYE